jgi:HSP20 family protein
MATLIRWDPLREIAQMQNEFGRLLGGLTGQGNGTTQAWVPAVDVWETENELVYAFDLPGIPQEKISLEFDEGALTVSAERERTQEVKQERFYRFERRHGSFSRTIGVPQGVTEDAIKAEYKDGVLEIHIEKPKAPEPRRIQIASTGEGSTIEGYATPSSETESQQSTSQQSA